MMRELGAIRARLADILSDMGELGPADSEALRADPETDFDLARVSFDSLAVLDLCLRIETVFGVILNPEEVVTLSSVNELQDVIVKRRPRLSEETS